MESTRGLERNDTKTMNKFNFVAMHICDADNLLVHCCGPEQEFPVLDASSELQLPAGNGTDRFGFLAGLGKYICCILYLFSM